MDRLFKDRWLMILLYILLSLLIVFMFLKIWPLFSGLWAFLKAVLMPFIIAIIISYVLNPVVNLLNQRKVPRTVAVLLIYAVFITSMTIILINMIPMFINQLKELNEHLPEIATRAQTMIDGFKYNSFLPQGMRTAVQNSIGKFENAASGYISGFVDGIGSTITMMFNAFIVPFLAFYMLKDFQIIEKTVLTFVPKGHRKHTIRILLDIDKALGNYIRGQFLVCLIIGLIAYIGYWLIGIPYPLLLASVVAVTNIIPYIGPFIGAAPALVVASTVSVKMVLYVLLVNTACQILEGNVISPQVVGRSLNLHPLMIIFALLAGGQIAGVPGLILAVPFVAVVKVILQHIFAYYINRKTV